MTHDELLEKIVDRTTSGISIFNSFALKAVVELHKPKAITWKGLPKNITGYYCSCAPWTNEPYPCLTIQAIEKELG